MLIVGGGYKAECIDLGGDSALVLRFEDGLLSAVEERVTWVGSGTQGYEELARPTATPSRPRSALERLRPYQVLLPSGLAGDPWNWRETHIR